MDEWALRKKMIDEQLVRRGIHDAATLASMALVPRHEFVPEQAIHLAYEDSPLPIGFLQTISQPYMVALMTQSARLKSTDKVLEIGTGSGYQAAVLSKMVTDVYTIERIPELSAQAQVVFEKLALTNIHLKIGDGTLGWPEEAPFDAILVTAGAPVAPQSLMNQIKVGGRLIIPVGNEFVQDLFCYTRTGEDEMEQEFLESVRFVPLIGEQGWQV